MLDSSWATSATASSNCKVGKVVDEFWLLAPDTDEFWLLAPDADDWNDVRVHVFSIP